MNDKIPQIVLSKFKSLHKKLDKFTVIAGIVMENQDVLECVAMGVGTKSLPDKLVDSNGFLLKDSHAEVICKRNFCRFLLYRLDSDLFELVVSKRRKLKSNIRFHLYISQAPCGDASMAQLDMEQTDHERTENEYKRQKFRHSPECGIIRGRLGYSQFGRLRTKPGRIDSDVSSCMSCSDKIARWNCLGWQGSALSLFIEPVFIESITIGDYFDREHLHRSLCLRTDGFQPQIIATNTIFPFAKSQIKGKSADVAFSWNCIDGLECIVQGKKQGSSKVTFTSACLISKVKLADLVWTKRELSSFELKSDLKYGEVKLLATEYLKKKNFLLSNQFRDWIVSRKETFPLVTL
jgi:tRNA-specific adenosine deaminase 1